ncbi:N-acetyltransferase [Acidothermaceae bacterium B102]|nr:N-acetyltransferase [Acidothermaceae bacterium B102]
MSDQRGSAQVRPYRQSDMASLYDICVRTADAGSDARGRWMTDDLMPDLFVAPYVHLAPHLAFVLEDDGHVVGYALGVANTPAFVEAYRRDWIPRTLDRYPAPTSAPTTPDEEMVALHHNPERLLVPEVRDHPAHLHIDLLPSHQGQGHGRSLMRVLMTALAADGAPAVHVGMLTANTGARGFYDRLGWYEIAVPDPGPLTYLGRATA